MEESLTKSMTLEEGDEATAESPLHHVISFLSAPASPPSKESVSIPALLQDFFGIDHLPRHCVDRANAANALAQQQLLQDAESIPSELSLEEDQQEQEATSAEFLDVKKKRRTVGALASRMRQVKERRKQRKRSDDTKIVNEHKTPSTHVNSAWIQKQHAKLQQHKATLENVQQETLEVETRAKNLQAHVSVIQQQVAELEQALSKSMASLQQDTKLLQQSKKDLKSLENKRNKAARAVQETAAVINAGRPPRARPRDDESVLNPMFATPSSATSTCSDPVRRRAESAPTVLRRTSSSFIRVHDLDLDTSSLSETSSLNEEAKDVFFLDHDVNTVLNALARSGYDLATDESARFVPALSTESMLSQYTFTNVDPSWPVQSWQAPQGKDILVWTGSVNHNGHGCDLPVIKARAIMPAAPRHVLELIMDSSRATEYNKMSQGRTDVLILQKGIDTLALESEYGVAGEAKIIRSLNKPPLIRRSIEMLSLIYARPLENADGYLAVNRSVWEDSSATPKPSKDTVRSEIMLGVNIFRAVPGPNPDETYCELTTITHAHAPVVPDAIARKMGPTQAATFMKDLQQLFSK